MTQHGTHRVRHAVTLAFALALAACGKGSNTGAPHRVDTKVNLPPEASVVHLPIQAEMRDLVKTIERTIPQTLWTINKKIDKCVPAQRVKVFGAKLKVSPDMSCTVIGNVTRGAIRVHGDGKALIADLPIHATVSARDVGGVLKGETATGSAMAHARIELNITPEWGVTGKVKLSYDWSNTPGIDFLGKRITFAEKADEKLGPVLRKLEQELAGELAKIQLRPKVEQLWAKAFTSVELNEKNPPVWMRLTPQQLIFDGYSVRDDRLNLDVGLKAATDVFVGPRPEDPKPTPLPPPGAGMGGQLRMFLPVIADYAQLEPVVLKALTKRSKRPFNLPVIGPVTAQFEKVTAYGTDGGRLAVGLQLAVKPQSTGRETRGMIWITAKPANAPGSAKVAFTDMKVWGDTNGVGADALLALGSYPPLTQEIAGALTQNFTKDLTKLLVKVRKALTDKRKGAVVFNATLTSVQTGKIRAFGEGVFLPVRVLGEAKLDYDPLGKQVASK